MMENNWWAYTTNYTNGTGVNGPSDFFVGYPSTLLGNGLAAGIVLMLWVTSFALSLAVGARKALAISSFITLILAIYLMKYLNPVILIVLVFLIIIGLIGGKSEQGI